MDLLFAYVVCFGVGLVFAVATAVTGHLFGGHDHPGDVGSGGHSEAGFGGDHMPSISPLSPTTGAAFITAFGGFGMIFSRLETTRSPFVSLPLALLGGLAVAFLVFILFRWVFARTQGSSESHVAELPGRQATVITPVSATSVGEIAYVDRGVRYTAAARSDDGSAVPAGATVVIRRIVAGQFYVSPLQPADRLPPN